MDLRVENQVYLGDLYLWYTRGLLGLGGDRGYSVMVVFSRLSDFVPYSTAIGAQEPHPPHSLSPALRCPFSVWPSPASTSLQVWRCPWPPVAAPLVTGNGLFSVKVHFGTTPLKFFRTNSAVVQLEPAMSSHVYSEGLPLFVTPFK